MGFAGKGADAVPLHHPLATIQADQPSRCPITLSQSSCAITIFLSVNPVAGGLLSPLKGPDLV